MFLCGRRSDQVAIHLATLHSQSFLLLFFSSSSSSSPPPSSLPLSSPRHLSILSIILLNTPYPLPQPPPLTTHRLPHNTNNTIKRNMLTRPRSPHGLASLPPLSEYWPDGGNLAGDCVEGTRAGRDSLEDD
ncbi:hypothetical protein E2C01_014046 [Portunus trituberculatus]|uniref:Uncharacterized protein n=1 Tax=Portunus trituberculatus TaxID=210409 RepID=A0A5B7DIZ0_PORTR|nr:hypothetical protein [Portunus trituberculatus]